MHIGWRDLTVLALVSTVGFTMALFFASVAVGPGPVLSELKMGAVVAIAGGVLAVAAAWLLGVGRFGHGFGKAQTETAP
jgi:Na+/H+ antiporter NhaA